MSIYWLVVDESKDKVIALVKTNKSNATVIAGSNLAANGFKGGKPNSLISGPWYFDPLTAKCYHPLVGEWLDKLGPVEDATSRLKNEREKELRRLRAKNLTPAQISKIKELRSNGVVIKKIADKFQVSESVIRKHVKGVSEHSAHELDPIYRVGLQNDLKVPELTASGRSKMALAGSAL